MKLPAVALLSTLLAAGCGARSHLPDDAVIDEDDHDEDVALPDAGSSDAKQPVRDDDDPAPEPPPGPTPEPGGCRDDECEDGRVCVDCPECPGGAQCGWPLDTACTREEIRNEAVAPNLMLLVDRSESMRNPIDGEDKWDVVVDALEAALPELDPIARLGLTMFPPPHGNCGAPEIDVEPADGGASAVLDALAAAEPLVATPLADALAAMAAAESLDDASRTQAVVLISDGGETCGMDPVRASRDLREGQPPVDLYAISLGRTDPLDELVASPADVGSAYDVAELTAELLGAGDRAAPCRIAITQGTPPSVYDERGVLVPRDESGREGYRLATDGDAIELHGAACRAWRSGAAVTLAWPCLE